MSEPTYTTAAAAAEARGEDADAAPAHWQPFADSERDNDDSYRR
ncbi:unnamed protein product [Plutella xylostella]|uniref:(diamondback moth) hypothetical protein n=1 Tax=Plutella xylostella TaxID=51655 RepID=A0A8S4FZ89_PLUXY|nr:unnamed protein product [Plutella xylostella]